jgi:AcrR family transcriptional regulator
MSPRKKEDFESIKDASRDKRLRSAFEVFAEDGYISSTVERIAKKAKISKGLVYHYFESKQDILKGIFSILEEHLKQFRLDGEALEPKEYIRKMIAFSFQFILQQTKTNRFILSLALQPRVIEGIQDEIAQIKQMWMGQLALMFKRLGYEDPSAEAHLLGAIFDGVSIGYQVIGKEYPISRIEQIIIAKYTLLKDE